MSTTANSPASNGKKAESSGWWIWGLLILVVVAFKEGFGGPSNGQTSSVRPTLYGQPQSHAYRSGLQREESDDGYDSRAAEREINATYQAAQNQAWQGYLDYQRQRREEDARRDPNPYD